MACNQGQSSNSDPVSNVSEGSADTALQTQPSAHSSVGERSLTHSSGQIPRTQGEEERKMKEEGKMISRTLAPNIQFSGKS